VKKLMILASLLSMLTSAAEAEPGPSVERLMSEPMSLFSFGLYRTELSVRDIFERAPGLLGESPHIFFHVNYDWDQDKIIISANILSASEVSRNEMKRLCETALGAIREDAGIVYGTMIGKTTIYAEYFTPLGFSRSSITAAAAEIDGMLFFQMRTKELSCDAPVVGDGYAITKR